jgi:hypothetical protein
MKHEPLSLALVFMNLCLLGFFYFILNRVADQRKEEVSLLYIDKRETRELLSKCIVPERRSERYNGGDQAELQPTPKAKGTPVVPPPEDFRAEPSTKD